MKLVSAYYFLLALAGHGLVLFAIPSVRLEGPVARVDETVYLEVALRELPPEPAAPVVQSLPQLEPEPPPKVEPTPVTPVIEPVVEKPPPKVEVIEPKKSTVAVTEPATTPTQPPSLNQLIPAVKPSAPPAVATPMPSAVGGYQPMAEAAYRKGGRAKVEYPPQARRLKQEGVVWLTLYINARGTLDRAEVKESSGYPLLDQAALAAEKKSRFQPAYSQGRPVACKVEVPYRFELK